MTASAAPSFCSSRSGFGSAAGGFEADAAADDYFIVAIIEGEFAAGVVAVDAAGIFEESGEFAVEGGDDGDLRHIRWP